MVSFIGLFALLALVIVVAGIALTRFADRIADATSMGHSLAGLLLLAAATSLPEFSVGWAAVRIDSADLAFGELLGSCLWNLLLLAALDLAIRSPARMFSSESAAQALIATVGILLAAIAMAGLALDYPAVMLRASPFSWAILIGYFLCIRLVYRDHVSVNDSSPETSSGDQQKVVHVRSTGLQKVVHVRSTGLQEVLHVRSTGRAALVKAVVGYLVCAAVIFLAAPKLAEAADRLADETGLGKTFLGATLVALVTSLPEAVTTLEAIRLGRNAMAVANIFGSNAFNLTILAAIDFATPHSLFFLAGDVHLVAATAVILVTAVTLLGILYRAEKQYWLIEPDALLVILLVFGSLTLIYHL